MRPAVLLPLLSLVAAVLLLAPRGSVADDPGRPRLVDRATQDALDRGLRFLAETQNEDGSWTSDAGQKVNEEYVVAPGGKNVHHVGITALAILAFLASGHAPGRGPYGGAVDRAVDFLLSRVQHDGFIQADQTRMYSHAFATLALAEVYGMSRSKHLRRKLEDAVELTVKCQNETGGWRYAPFGVDSDMSVTVCQLVALRAAMNVGLRVKQATIDRALGYVLQSAITSSSPASEDEVGGFWYQPASTRWNRSSFPLTAAGLTSLFQAGIYDDVGLRRYVANRGLELSGMPSVERSIEYMERAYDGVARQYRRHYFFYYGNYYAAQAMYTWGRLEPTRWERWYDRVRRDLLALEVRTPGRGARSEVSHWESNVGDTHTYATAVALLILAMPLDYLPIHQN
ncbi:MAG: prenyltransferase/squalene oxidase repeat-containing protein [Planctomycetota bacterium]